MSIKDVIINLQWDGWTDRFTMPIDYLRMSVQERLLIPIEQLKVYAPREMFLVPDWGFERLFSATMLHGFRPNVFAFGSGAGVQKYSRIFIIDTALTKWQVPNDWNNNDNFVELIGGGGQPGKADFGWGGHGGGGGAYARREMIQFTKDAVTGAFPETPIKVGKGNGSVTIATDTFFKDQTWFRADGGSTGNGGKAEESLGEVTVSGGSAGNGNAVGDDRRIGKEDSHGHIITTDYFGGGGGGGGGGGAAGPDGAGSSGFTGSKGKDATQTAGGQGGGGGAGGDGGLPSGGNGPANGAGGVGTAWTTHGSGGGGAGGDGGKGGLKTYQYASHNPSTERTVLPVKGTNGGSGGRYGAGGGGGGGGGRSLNPTNDGDNGDSNSGLIVITNNATSVIT